MRDSSINKHIPSYGWVASEFERLGYSQRVRYRELNLIAIRMHPYGFNQWNDYIGAFWYENHLPYFKVFRGTTLPGRYYLVDKLLNPKGCAILLPGQYPNSYKMGKHKGTPAIVQDGAIKISRDANRDQVYDFTNPQQASNIGLNIHTTRGIFPFVNKYSAGCLVVRDPVEFGWLLNLAEESEGRWGGKFDLTLLEF
jgi:hypothetical protein